MGLANTTWKVSLYTIIGFVAITIIAFIIYYYSSRTKDGVPTSTGVGQTALFIGAIILILDIIVIPFISGIGVIAFIIDLIATKSDNNTINATAARLPTALRASREKKLAEENNNPQAGGKRSRKNKP